MLGSVHMVAAFYLLLVAGHLGFFDVIYFHHLRCRLQDRPQCQREVLWHTLRHLVYACQFVAIANLRFYGPANARGYHLMSYRTDVALGIEVKGIGRYLHSSQHERSTFEFDSDDWKSIIRDGRGLWLYEARGDRTYFKTIYDYEHRHGSVGWLIDRLLFRRLLQLATEWGFETLRLWTTGDAEACRRRRSRWRFGLFFLWRMLGGRPAAHEAQSWLGSGQETLLESAASDAKNLASSRTE